MTVRILGPLLGLLIAGTSFGQMIYYVGDESQKSGDEAVQKDNGSDAIQKDGSECQKGTDCCVKGDDCCCPFELFPETCRGIKIGGWFQMGYHTEGANQGGANTGGTAQWNFPPPAANNKVNSFNNYPNVVQLHQAWVYAEKVAENCGCGWDWGFRLDYVYGTDGQDTQAFGSEPGNWDTSWDNGGFYGSALPQLYGEVAYNDLKVKAGHFFTPAGYERVQAPENFFYSRSISSVFAPYTHTGFLAEYALSDRTTLYGGWATGWDTGFDQNGGDMYITGFGFELNECTSLTYMAMTGDFGFVVPGPGSDQTGYFHSLILDRQMSDRMNYVLESNYLDNGQLAPFGQVLTVNQYLFYTLNCRWALGGRFEYVNFAAANIDYSEVTFGANYRPHSNVVIRPEMRVDVLHDQPGLQDSTVFGVDAIVTY